MKVMAEYRFLNINNDNLLPGFCLGLIAFFLFLLPQQVQAGIKTGLPCSECHTMHNSQDGVAMTAATTEALLRSSCVGCHTGTNVNPTSVGYPYVFDTAGANYGTPGTGTGTSGHDTLAGGNFYWVQSNPPSSDRKGHNVAGIAAQDQLFGNTIPGSGGITLTGNQITCAGTDGCHGDGAGSDIVSIMPAHHVSDSTITGNTVGESYRFLSGVVGIEDADWEFSVDLTDHNQYKGSKNYADDPTNTDTITSACVKCHGYFHGQYSGVSGTGGASLDGATPWVRHPTDVDIAANLYNSTVYDNYTSYKPIAPVASSADPLVLVTTTVQTAGNGIITCITCHRAHGTPYDALLRWDYKNWPACSPDCDGCQVCHSDKN